MASDVRKVFVAGHRGMVGSAVLRNLANHDVKVLCEDRSKLDLTSRQAVDAFIAKHKPDAVILAAAKVGGIHANNTQRYEFISQNVAIANNVICSAHEHDVDRLIYLGSSCIYPKMADQPLQEQCLLSGYLEYTNRPYAIAKIAGLELVNAIVEQFGRQYISAMPTNLYGPGDNFDLENAHVLPALMHRMHLAKLNGDKEVAVWGSGKPRREFLHVDDCAAAVVHLLFQDLKPFFHQVKQSDLRYYHVNVGSGQEVTIRELCESLKRVVGFEGKLVFDSSKPDGTPRKLLDCRLINSFGWSPQIQLEQGMEETYRWFLSNHYSLRSAS